MTEVLIRGSEPNQTRKKIRQRLQSSGVEGSVQGGEGEKCQSKLDSVSCRRQQYDGIKAVTNSMPQVL